MKNWNTIKKVIVRKYEGDSYKSYEYDTLVDALKSNRFNPNKYNVHTNSWNTSDPWDYVRVKSCIFYDELGMVIDPEFVLWTYTHFISTYHRWTLGYRGSKKRRWRKSKSMIRDYRFMNKNRAIDALEYDEEIEDYRHMIKDRAYLKTPSPWEFDEQRHLQKNWKSHRKTQWK